MHLHDILPEAHQGQWTHSPLCWDHQTLRGHPETLLEAANLRYSTKPPLHEATYKELAGLIDPNFLSQKVRSDALNGVFYLGFDGDTMVFEINSSEFDDNGIKYRNLVKFDEWDQIGQDGDLNSQEKARMLLWVGNIRLFCGCPSFLFHGYQYLLTVLDASIYPEQRPPVIRNPQQRGIVCKHGHRLLKVLPFYSGQIAKAITQQFGS